MPEWLIERGVAEERALLLDGDEILAAKLRWPEDLPAGRRISAQLLSKPSGTRRGLARTDGGTEILVDKLPSTCTEGQSLTLRITRDALAEKGRLKRPQGRVVDEAAPATEESDVFATGTPVRRFAAGLWEEVWQSAASAETAFAGGTLQFAVTPAMVLVDIDGDLAPRDLALAAVPALARALSLFDLGGSIGVDFPTLEAKAERKAVDAALEEALAAWPHERTAMNGFGFVQIVARLEGPSLLHRFATARASAAARMALRMAERVEGAGATLLRVHPALAANMASAWREEVERRTGRPLVIEEDPALALESPSAQIVPHD